MNFYTFEFLYFLDVDECGNGNHDCDMKANCMNTNGSFVCVCNSGWSGDGVVCKGEYFILCVNLLYVSCNLGWPMTNVDRQICRLFT